MESVTQAWQRIDTWFRTFAPQTSASLHPGATAEEIAETEATLGLHLPEDVQASYRIHNGGGYGTLMGWEGFFSLSGLVNRFQRNNEVLQNAHLAALESDWVERHQTHPEDQPALPVQPVWRHRSWLDIAGNGSGDYWCIDLAPGAFGHVGQVLFWQHDGGGVREVLFPSFGAMLSAYADQLEAGVYPLPSSALPMRALMSTPQRRGDFQQPTAAKSVLYQAIKWSWDPHSGVLDEDCIEAFQQVLHIHAATPEDRFFAYYGIFAWCCYVGEEVYDKGMALFPQFEAEASRMPQTHWVHEQVTFLKSNLS